MIDLNEIKTIRKSKLKRHKIDWYEVAFGIVMIILTAIALTTFWQVVSYYEIVKY